VHYINSNGGLYSKDLDRTCTHLIANKPTTERNPSEKVKWAVKEVAAREALRRAGKKVEDEDMRIVYEEWVWDCVACEGRWKEDWYDARKVRRAARASAGESCLVLLSLPARPPNRSTIGYHVGGISG
jgi:DNA replication regulator DPB11